MKKWQIALISGGVATLTAAGIAMGVGLASASSASSAPPPLPQAHPKPHIINEAHGLKGRVLKHGNGKPVKVAAFSDGCEHAYGLPTQCLTLRAPGNKVWTCTLVHPYFPAGIAVAKPGRDPFRLDRNKDGVACDAADF